MGNLLSHARKSLQSLIYAASFVPPCVCVKQSYFQATLYFFAEVFPINEKPNLTIVKRH